MFGDWTLTYPSSTYAFGPPGRPVRLVSWTFAGDAYRAEDTQLADLDGILFGRDLVEAGELTVDIRIDYSDRPLPAADRARMAWAARQEFARAWRGDEIRRSPLAVAMLNLGGEFAIEGRGRRVTWNDDRQNRGIITGTAVFVPAGTGVFAVVDGGIPWRRVEVGLGAPTSGGWRFPLRFPLRNMNPAIRSTSFEVGGEATVSPLVHVTGPIAAGASLQVGSAFEVVTNRRLAHDETAVADGRHGHALLSVNGRPENWLAPSSAKLSSLRLTPGTYQIALRGISPEGTARAAIEWQEKKAS
ncbi:hypothetical protein [Leucobacter luti]|uniref:hypothetical protein n=1 Tax=Leucobacter luti TaxID=340320 RepID=UPI003D0264D3